MNKYITAIFYIFCASFLIAQPKQTFSETPLFSNGIDGYACYCIPAILTTSNGELLAFAEGRKNGCNDFGNVDIVFKRSTDNGQTWQQQAVVVDNEILQVGNYRLINPFHQSRPFINQSRINLYQSSPCL